VTVLVFKWWFVSSCAKNILLFHEARGALNQNIPTPYLFAVEILQLAQAFHEQVQDSRDSYNSEKVAEVRNPVQNERDSEY
jgi:hypothetical protein